MITTFNTPALAGKNGSNTGLIIGVLAVLGAWAAYEFWWKPKQELENKK